MGPALSARRRGHRIRNPERADGSRTEQRLQPTPRGVLQGAARLNLTLAFPEAWTEERCGYRRNHYASQPRRIRGARRKGHRTRWRCPYEEDAERLRGMIRELGTPNLTFDNTSHSQLEGRSLLHKAVADGRPLAVKVLLEEGADRGAEMTIDGKSAGRPIDVAYNFFAAAKQLGMGATWASWQPTAHDRQQILILLREGN